MCASRRACCRCLLRTRPSRLCLQGAASVVRILHKRPGGTPPLLNVALRQRGAGVRGALQCKECKLQGRHRGPRDTRLARTHKPGVWGSKCRHHSMLCPPARAPPPRRAGRDGTPAATAAQTTQIAGPAPGSAPRGGVNVQGRWLAARGLTRPTTAVLHEGPGRRPVPAGSRH